MADFYTEFKANVIHDLCEDYKFSKEVVNLIFDKAWHDFHSNSYDEVIEGSYELADWLEDVIAAMK